jgi:hypothetical protein
MLVLFYPYGLPDPYRIFIRCKARVYSDVIGTNLHHHHADSAHATQQACEKSSREDHCGLNTKGDIGWL